MHTENKKELALEVIRRLKQAYPDAACSLDYNEAWKLLVSVRLAAQCTDARVNMIVPKLYEKFPDVNALADAPVEEIEEIVRPCGLGKSKARDISACMRMLRDVYGGNVPNDFNALLKLPGVGKIVKLYNNHTSHKYRLSKENRQKTDFVDYLPKNSFKSSSTVPIPAMPNVSVRIFATFGERNAGRVGPRWIFFTPSANSASSTITAFCSYHAML